MNSPLNSKIKIASYEFLLLSWIRMRFDCFGTILFVVADLQTE